MRRVLISAAKHLSDQAQPLIASPDSRSLGQRHRCQQMNIDIPDSFAMQNVTIDEAQNFVALGHCSGW